MKQAVRQEWRVMLDRLGEERPDFCALFCNVCKFMDRHAADDYDCVHPLFPGFSADIYSPTISIEMAVESGQEMGDCWLFRPRPECRALEDAEAFIRSGAVDSPEYDDLRADQPTEEEQR